MAASIEKVNCLGFGKVLILLVPPKTMKDCTRVFLLVAASIKLWEMKIFISRAASYFSAERKEKIKG